MAGHSQFKNIMHRKGAQDKKRAKVFAKLSREITVAAKSGMPDPDANPRLRGAIQAAKQQNMPNDRIDRAIQAGSPDGDSADYEAVRYEGYGPGGVAMIIEALTDNRNRTASDVRAAFGKHGGNLGESGSVSFMFDHIGSIAYPADAVDFDTLFEAAVEAGAEDVRGGQDQHEVCCATDDLHAVSAALEEKFGAPENATLDWRPQNMVPVSEEHAQTIMKLIDTLEDNDDVQSVHSNFEVSDEILERLTA